MSLVSGILESFEVIKSSASDHTSLFTPNVQKASSEVIFLELADSGSKDILKIVDDIDKTMLAEEKTRKEYKNNKERALVHVPSKDRALVKVHRMEKGVPYGKILPIYNPKDKQVGTV